MNLRIPRLVQFGICAGLILHFVAIARATAIPTSPTTSETAMPSVTDAENAFGADLYLKLAPTPGNLFFSPYSIHTALAMARDGAKGTTADQMSKTLHLSGDQAETDAAFAIVTDALNQGGTANDRTFYQLVVANALWIQRGYPIHPEFSERLKKAFGGEAADVDFAHQMEQSRGTINSWVASKTADKIKELLGPGALDPATRLVLTNAIYFKSAWQNPFDKASTGDAPFHLMDGKSVDVPTMRMIEKCNYCEDEQKQAVELPYVGGRLSMVLILPRKAEGMGDVETSLMAEKPGDFLKKMRRAEVTLALPRFKLKATLQLSKELVSMGMTDAFSPQTADFSGMATAEQLYIGAVVHKATIDVDEKGTEAAAATAIGMSAMAMIEMDERTFTADHPFVFLIREYQTGNVLFMGRMADPRP